MSITDDIRELLLGRRTAPFGELPVGTLSRTLGPNRVPCLKIAPSGPMNDELEACGMDPALHGFCVDLLCYEVKHVKNDREVEIVK